MTFSLHLARPTLLYFLWTLIPMPFLSFSLTRCISFSWVMPSSCLYFLSHIYIYIYIYIPTYVWWQLILVKTKLKLWRLIYIHIYRENYKQNILGIYMNFMICERQKNIQKYNTHKVITWYKKLSRSATCLHSQIVVIYYFQGKIQDAVVQCLSLSLSKQHTLNPNMKQWYLYPTYKIHNGLKIGQKYFMDLVLENFPLKIITLLYWIMS